MVSVAEPTRTTSRITATRRVYHRGRLPAAVALVCPLCLRAIRPQARIVYAAADGPCENELYHEACHTDAYYGSD